MGRSVILLVEDEADLLQVISTALARAMPAYDVVSVATLEEAEHCLAGLEKEGTSLAVAVIDHMLGGSLHGEASTGLVLLEQVSRRFPSAATFLFTGQATAPIEQRARAHGARVLWKPIRLSALLGEVTAALD